MRGLAFFLGLFLGLSAGCGTNGGTAEGKAPEARSAALEQSTSQARLIAQLAPRLEQRGRNLTPVTRADGGRSLRMNGHFSQAQMARVNADGSVTATCVDNVEAAARVVHRDATATSGGQP